ncbi:hypothetical protein SKAU_G00414540 [Synaphobranchus kaupii]|uniref:Uncharacterized protein n=1 Tax=Synaphobranchus kaupii TaxID=118154 RepID=A0A9Q1E748_SYNKA|nr:hypothetical protein SKAU_G00414540 [Synaphobranchus kaupii]
MVAHFPGFCHDSYILQQSELYATCSYGYFGTENLIGVGFQCLDHSGGTQHYMPERRTIVAFLLTVMDVRLSSGEDHIS